MKSLINRSDIGGAVTTLEGTASSDCFLLVPVQGPDLWPTEFSSFFENNNVIFSLFYVTLLADPGKARGCSTNNSVID